jgi:hypothetical protein
MIRVPVIIISATSLLAVGGFQPETHAQDGLSYEEYVSYQAQGAEVANNRWRQGFQEAKQMDPEFNREYKDVTFHFAGRGEAEESTCAGTIAADPAEYQDRRVNPAFHCAREDAVYFASGWLYREYYTEIGDYAPWVIIAHEVGHHVQKQIGVIDKNGNPCCWWPKKAIELNADCLAGVLAFTLEDEGYMAKGSSEEGARTVFTLGDKDDNSPDPHGSPEERHKSFSTGYQSGNMDKCTEELAKQPMDCDPKAQDCSKYGGEQPRGRHVSAGQRAH